MDGHRKLLVLGINKLVQDGLISLAWNGNDRVDEQDEGHILTDLAGQPSVVSWCDVGFGEIRTSVWWKYDHSRHPQANSRGNSREEFRTSSPLAKRLHYPKFVGATVSGWLERQKGPHLQGSGADHLFDIYTRRGEMVELDAVAIPKPNGFAAEGKFYL